MQRAAHQYDFCVSWKPFLLRPTMPWEGLPKPPGSARVFADIKAAGEEVGIEFTGKAEVYPNSIQAHILLGLVENDSTTQHKISEALFKAYFTDGLLPNEETLSQIACDHGLDLDMVIQAISDKEKQNQIQQKAAAYARDGVNGVPFFYMNGQKTFSGAQEPETFIRMFEIIAEKFPASNQPAASRSSSNL